MVRENERHRKTRSLQQREIFTLFPLRSFFALLPQADLRLSGATLGMGMTETKKTA